MRGLRPRFFFRAATRDPSARPSRLLRHEPVTTPARASPAGTLAPAVVDVHVLPLPPQPAASSAPAPASQPRASRHADQLPEPGVLADRVEVRVALGEGAKLLRE